MPANLSVETVPAPKRCAVEWCRRLAYPGSDMCQFHEVVNPYDDSGHDPDLDDNGVCRVCGQFEPE